MGLEIGPYSVRAVISDLALLGSFDDATITWRV